MVTLYSLGCMWGHLEHSGGGHRLGNHRYIYFYVWGCVFKRTLWGNSGCFLGCWGVCVVHVPAVLYKYLSVYMYCIIMCSI